MAITVRGSTHRVLLDTSDEMRSLRADNDGWATIKLAQTGGQGKGLGHLFRTGSSPVRLEKLKLGMSCNFNGGVGMGVSLRLVTNGRPASTAAPGFTDFVQSMDCAAPLDLLTPEIANVVVPPNAWGVLQPHTNYALVLSQASSFSYHIPMFNSSAVHGADVGVLSYMGLSIADYLSSNGWKSWGNDTALAVILYGSVLEEGVAYLDDAGTTSPAAVAGNLTALAAAGAAPNASAPTAPLAVTFTSDLHGTVGLTNITALVLASRPGLYRVSAQLRFVGRTVGGPVPFAKPVSANVRVLPGDLRRALPVAMVQGLKDWPVLLPAQQYALVLTVQEANGTAAGTPGLPSFAPTNGLVFLNASSSTSTLQNFTSALAGPAVSNYHTFVITGFATAAAGPGPAPANGAPEGDSSWQPIVSGLANLPAVTLIGGGRKVMHLDNTNSLRSWGRPAYFPAVQAAGSLVGAPAVVFSVPAFAAGRMAVTQLQSVARLHAPGVFTVYASLWIAHPTTLLPLYPARKAFSAVAIVRASPEDVGSDMLLKFDCASGWPALSAGTWAVVLTTNDTSMSLQLAVTDPAAREPAVTSDWGLPDYYPSADTADLMAPGFAAIRTGAMSNGIEWRLDGSTAALVMLGEALKAAPIVLADTSASLQTPVFPTGMSLGFISTFSSRAVGVVFDAGPAGVVQLSSVTVLLRVRLPGKFTICMGLYAINKDTAAPSGPYVGSAVLCQDSYTVPGQEDAVVAMSWNVPRSSWAVIQEDSFALVFYSQDDSRTVELMRSPLTLEQNPGSVRVAGMVQQILSSDSWGLLDTSSPPAIMLTGSIRQTIYDSTNKFSLWQFNPSEINVSGGPYLHILFDTAGSMLQLRDICLPFWHGLVASHLVPLSLLQVTGWANNAPTFSEPMSMRAIPSFTRYFSIGATAYKLNTACFEIRANDWPVLQPWTSYALRFSMPGGSSVLMPSYGAGKVSLLSIRAAYSHISGIGWVYSTDARQIPQVFISGDVLPAGLLGSTNSTTNMTGFNTGLGNGISLSSASLPPAAVFVVEGQQASSVTGLTLQFAVRPGHARQYNLTVSLWEADSMSRLPVRLHPAQQSVKEILLVAPGSASRPAGSPLTVNIRFPTTGILGTGLQSWPPLFPGFAYAISVSAEAEEAGASPLIWVPGRVQVGAVDMTVQAVLASNSSLSAARDAQAVFLSTAQSRLDAETGKMGRWENVSSRAVLSLQLQTLPRGFVLADTSVAGRESSSSSSSGSGAGIAPSDTGNAITFTVPAGAQVRLSQAVVYVKALKAVALQLSMQLLACDALTRLPIAPLQFNSSYRLAIPAERVGQTMALDLQPEPGKVATLAAGVYALAFRFNDTSALRLQLGSVDSTELSIGRVLGILKALTPAAFGTAGSVKGGWVGDVASRLASVTLFGPSFNPVDPMAEAVIASNTAFGLAVAPASTGRAGSKKGGSLSQSMGTQSYTPTDGIDLLTGDSLGMLFSVPEAPYFIPKSFSFWFQSAISGDLSFTVELFAVARGSNVPTVAMLAAKKMDIDFQVLPGRMQLNLTVPREWPPLRDGTFAVTIAITKGRTRALLGLDAVTAQAVGAGFTLGSLVGGARLKSGGSGSWVALPSNTLPAFALHGIARKAVFDTSNGLKVGMGPQYNLHSGAGSYLTVYMDSDPVAAVAVEQISFPAGQCYGLVLRIYNANFDPNTQAFTDVQPDRKSVV